VGSIVLYEILAHWPQYATHIPGDQPVGCSRDLSNLPSRYESIGQVTDNPRAIGRRIAFEEVSD
jgi:hypothetical protein